MILFMEFGRSFVQFSSNFMQFLSILIQLLSNFLCSNFLQFLNNFSKEFKFFLLSLAITKDAAGFFCLSHEPYFQGQLSWLEFLCKCSKSNRRSKFYSEIFYLIQTDRFTNSETMLVSCCVASSICFVDKC
jgi:hypothetical protein